jgi:hypothetical protein
MKNKEGGGLITELKTEIGFIEEINLIIQSLAKTGDNFVIFMTKMRMAIEGADINHIMTTIIEVIGILRMKEKEVET